MLPSLPTLLNDIVADREREAYLQHMQRHRKTLRRYHDPGWYESDGKLVDPDLPTIHGLPPEALL